MKYAKSITPRDRFGTSTEKAKQGNGGLRVIKHGMQRADKSPCKECPLRRSSTPGYLGGYTPEMYVEVMKSPASIACHMSPGFYEGDIPRQRHCTGIAAFRANTGHIAAMNGRPTHAHESTEYVGSNADEFFANEQEFIEHHAKGQAV